ncbi:MAG: hypothetical protein H6618_04575 [Deltaproteobacteria bacterium]|nr:hypothetical protein [Deltaproteobacteria bacterium]
MGNSALVSAPAPLSSVEEAWKNTFWSTGLTGERFTFKAGNGYELLGNSGGVAVGYGYIQGRWFLSGEGEILVGPFDPSYRRILNVDYQGTALQLWWGYSAEELDLRHPDGGYGFIFGLNYKDMVGRSVDRRKDPRAGPSTWAEMQENFNHSIRTTSLSLTPGIFFCWMQDPRPDNRSSLMTRIEGYILSVTYSMPLYARYIFRYDSWEFKDPHMQDEAIRQGDGFQVHPDDIESQRRKISGTLKGHSIMIRLQALLGA